MSEYDELVKKLRSFGVTTRGIMVGNVHDAADTIQALQSQVDRLKGVLETVQKELKATQLVSLHLINELEEIASYDTAIECDEDGEEEQVEADVLIKRARSALEAKP